MTSWTADRLQRLFSHYNRKYWRGGLLEFCTLIDNSLDAQAEILFPKKQIRVNLQQHRSDASIRATLFHEMAHLAAGKAGHNSAFFWQIEKLLSRNAPIQIGFPENENRKWLHVVPRRFRLLREKLDRPYARRQHWIERYSRSLKVPEEVITPESVEQEVEKAAFSQGLTWKMIIAVLEERYGFINSDGKPLIWARPHLKAAKRGYRRGRRSYLIEKELERKYGINLPGGTKK